MRMDSMAKLGGGGFEGFAERYLRNHIGRAMPDNLASEDFAVLFARDQFDEAFGVIDRDRLAQRSERDLADLDLDVARFGVGLAESDRGDLGLAVGARRDAREIEARITHAGHDLDRRDALARRLVREQGRARRVANRVNARATGAERIIDFDEPAAL